MHGQDSNRAASAPPLPEGSHVFMGYGSIEDLLGGRDAAATQLYLFPGTDRRVSKFSNVHACTYYTTLSLIEAGVVHYCRIRFAEIVIVTDHDGQPVGDCQRELARIEARGLSLDSCVHAYLTRRGFAHPRIASPSFPDVLRLVEGAPTFAVWDDARMSFVESEVIS